MPVERRKPGEVYTAKEAAARLRVTPELIYKLCKRGLIPGAMRIGVDRGTIRIPEQALRSYMEKCCAAMTAEPDDGEDGSFTPDQLAALVRLEQSSRPAAADGQSARRDASIAR